MKCRGNDPSILTLPLVLGYCGLLLALSTFLKPPLDSTLPVDQIGHFIIFAGLGVAVARYFSEDFGTSAPLGLALTILSCAFFGLCDEAYQSLMWGRNAEGLDLLIDALGAATGGVLYLILIRRVCGHHSERTSPIRNTWPFKEQI